MNISKCYTNRNVLSTNIRLSMLCTGEVFKDLGDTLYLAENDGMGITCVVIDSDDEAVAIPHLRVYVKLDPIVERLNHKMLIYTNEKLPLASLLPVC